jgi:hypothetical protein
MSELIDHDIVSNGDTIIILKNPSIKFAEWQPVDPSVDSAERRAFAPPYSGKKKKKKGKKEKSINVSNSYSNESVIENSVGLEDTIPSDDRGPISASVPESMVRVGQSIFGDGPSDTGPTIATSKDVEAGKSEAIEDHTNDITPDIQEIEKSTNDSTLPVESGIRFRVCAGNLMSASPTFNALLKKDGWMESCRNPEDMMFYLSAEDFDEGAFIIMMNIFHLRNRKVPRTITLEMLAEIAVIADYYNCDESIELFVDIWVADLESKTPVPATYCRDLVLWMWVSYAFKLSDIFKQTTSVAIKQCAGPFRDLGFPIPASYSSM